MVKSIKKYVCLHPFVSIGIVIFLFYSYGIFKINTISNTDEFSSIAIPIKFAGYDINIDSTWHGYGFSILFTPLFMLLDSFTAVYKIMLCGMLVLLSAYGYLIYSILHRNFEIDSLKAIAGGLLAAIGAFAPFSEMPTSLMNEIPLAFIFMLVVSLTMKVSFTGKNLFGNSLLCGILLAYCSLIHSRALVVYAALFIALMVTCFFYKDKNFLIMGVGIGISFLLCFLFVQYINDVIVNFAYDSIDNTLIDTKSTAGKIKKIFEFYRWPFAIKTFLCISANAAIASGGMSILGFIASFSLILKGIQRKISADKFFIAVVGVIAFYGMNFMISLDSIGPVMEGNYRWLSYIRYCRPFWGALFIVLYVRFFIEDIHNTKVKILFITLFLFCEFVIHNQLTPILLNSGYGLNYNIFGHLNLIKKYNLNVEFFYDLFLKTVLLLSVFILIAKNCWKKCFIYIIFSLFINIDFLNYNVRYSEYHETRINKSISIIESCDENTEIFCGGSKNYSYRLVLHFYGKEIIKIPKEIDCEKSNAIYLSDNREYIQECNYVISLDENEYIGFNNTEFLYNLEPLIELYQQGY